MLGPCSSRSSSPWLLAVCEWPLQGSVSSASGGLGSVLSEPPFFSCFRKVPRPFIPRLGKMQQEWATQGQIRVTRLRGIGRGNTGQCWVIWTSRHLILVTSGRRDEGSQTGPELQSQCTAGSPAYFLEGTQERSSHQLSQCKCKQIYLPRPISYFAKTRRLTIVNKLLVIV